MDTASSGSGSDCLEAVLVQSILFVLVLFYFPDCKRSSYSLSDFWKIKKSTKRKTKITHNFTTQNSVNIKGTSFLYFSLNINTFYLQNWDYNISIYGFIIFLF